MQGKARSKTEYSGEIEMLKERIDWVPDWIWEVDADGVILYSNAVVRELLGRSPEDVVGKTLISFVAADDASKCREMLEHAASLREPVRNVLTRFVAEDSSIKTAEVSCVPMLGPEDRLIGYRGITIDITDQLAAERLAQEAEANYRVLVENSQTGIFIVQNGLLVYVNPRISELMGYSREEVLGTPIMRYVVPEDAAWLSQYEERRTAGKNVPTHYTARGITKTGDIRRFEFRASVIQHGGAPAILLNAVDITDSARIEEALRKSENEFRNLVEKISDWVWQVDENTIYTYASPRVRDLLGYEPEEVVGKSPYELMPPDYAKLIGKQLEPIRAKHAPLIRFENPKLHRDGHTVWVETSGEPVFDEQGGFRGYRGIDRDITERKRAEALARESEEQYKTLFESSPLPMWVFCLENLTFLAVNEAMIRHYGYTRKELIGKSIMDIRPAEEVPRLHEHIEKKLKQGLDTGGLWQHRKKDGTLIDVEITSHTIEWHGKPAVFILANDVTERIKTEEQLRRTTSEMETVFHAFPDLYFWLDAEGRIINYHVADTSELYVPPEVFLGKRFSDVLPKDIGQELAKAAKKVRQTGSFVAVEYALDLPSGEGCYEARLLPVPENQILVIVRNITERVHADEALGASREMLRLVLTNIPQFIFWKDINSVYLGCNDNFARFTGVGTPEGIIGKTDYDLAWTKEQADSYGEWDRRVMASDKPEYHIAETATTSEGTIIVDTNKVPLHDAEGRVVGILGTYEDITERRQSEQALQEAEAKYRSLVEETMVGVYLIQDDQFAYVNPRMLEIFGCEPEDMLGKSPLEFTAPADRAVVVENIRRRLSGDVKSVRYAFTAVRKDGTPIDVETHGAVTNYQGKPAIIGSLVDITERKRYFEAIQDSEERYRQLFEHSPDMVFLVSAATSTFVAMNPAVTRVLGYPPYDILGKTPWDISPEFQPDGERSIDKAGRLLAGQLGAPPQLFEWMHKRKDGSLIECEVSLVYYKFHGDDLIQAIVRDITERKHAEETRRGLERDLEAQKRVFYRDTILSVTNGKLNICEYAEVEPYVVKAVSGVEVNGYSEVATARRQVEAFFLEHGLTGDRENSFMVGVGEAITNAVKHGVQGRVYMGADDECVWVAASDKGKGIESLILPRAVLLRGFSTKPSLGMGYSIMLDVSDRILLNTGDQGTTVVLIKEKEEQDLKVLPEYLPDTWDNVPG